MQKRSEELWVDKGLEGPRSGCIPLQLKESRMGENEAETNTRARKGNDNHWTDKDN